MVKIVWTDLAKEDLRSIFDYISRDSRVYASRYVDKLISRVDQLESNPKSGRIVPEINKEEVREDFPTGTSNRFGTTWTLKN